VLIGVWHINFTGDINMKNTLLNLYIRVQALLSQEEGQDLVEYALVVALIALAATAGMTSLSTAISSGLTNIGVALTGDIA
jgi:pilus assembly protein Flp/PilA